MDFLLKKFWDGPYYEIIESNLKKEEKKQCFRYIGRTTEMYVQGLLKFAFGKSFQKLISQADIPICDAAITINPKWKMVFEVKAKRPTQNMVSGSENPSDLDSVDQMVFQGLRQLDERIANLINDGFKGRITPVLVTGGFFPVSELFWNSYFDSIKNLSMFQNTNVDWPQLMDLEALEMFTALRGNVRIGDMLREKLNNDWKKESFQSFLFFYFLPSKKLVEPFNPVLSSLFEDRMYDLFKLLDPIGKHRVEENKLWQSAFDLS